MPRADNAIPRMASELDMGTFGVIQNGPHFPQEVAWVWRDHDTHAPGDIATEVWVVSANFQPVVNSGDSLHFINLGVTFPNAQEFLMAHNPGGVHDVIRHCVTHYGAVPDVPPCPPDMPQG